MPVYANFWGIMTSKVGQTDLVLGFWFWSEFISKSMRARLQVSVYNSYDLTSKQSGGVAVEYNSGLFSDLIVRLQFCKVYVQLLM